MAATPRGGSTAGGFTGVSIDEGIGGAAGLGVGSSSRLLFHIPELS